MEVGDNWRGLFSEKISIKEVFNMSRCSSSSLVIQLFLLAIILIGT